MTRSSITATALLIFGSLAIDGQSQQERRFITLQLSGTNPASYFGGRDSNAPGGCILEGAKDFIFFTLVGNNSIKDSGMPLTLVPVGEDREVGLQGPGGEYAACRLGNRAVNRFVLKIYTATQRAQTIAQREAKGAHADSALSADRDDDRR
jgi:hypothetical protein